MTRSNGDVATWRGISGNITMLRVLYPASGTNITKIECLISQLEHDSFEHGMAELASTFNSTVASNMRNLWCVGSNPCSRYSIYLKNTLLTFGDLRVTEPHLLPLTRTSLLSLHLRSHKNCTENRGTTLLRNEGRKLNLPNQKWGRGWVLCPSFGKNTTKIECLISRLKHDTFEHAMAALVSALNSTAASNMRKLWCVGSSPGSRHSIYLWNTPYTRIVSLNSIHTYFLYIWLHLQLHA